MRHSLKLEHLRQFFRFIDRYCADQHRLTLIVAFFYLIDYSAQLAPACFINHIGMICAYHWHVGRDCDDVQPVNLAELAVLGQRRTSHTREFFIHAEIVLESDGGKRFIFFLDFNVFFRFDSLVQTVGIASAEHQAPGKSIDDNDFVILDDVIFVDMHNAVCLDRLMDMVSDCRVCGVGKVFDTEKFLRFGDTRSGQNGGFLFFIHYIIGVDIIVDFLGIKLFYAMLAHGADQPVCLVIQIG